MGIGVACSLSARGRAGATEAKPPASDLVGAAAPGHGGVGASAEPGHGGSAAACIQASRSSDPDH